MKVEDLINKLKNANIRIDLVDGNLRVSYPNLSNHENALIDELRVRKAEVIEFIKVSSMQSVAFSKISTSNAERLDYPISHAQKRLLLLTQQDDALIAYNSFGVKRLVGPLDLKKIQLAVNVLVERHESLRTIFKITKGEFRQQVLYFDEADAQIHYIDLRNHRCQEEKIIAQCDSEAKHRFELDRLPLFRLSLLQIGTREYIFLCNIHHIISDGWSLKVFFSELMYLYNSRFDQLKAALPPLKLQYKDFSSWHNALLNDERFVQTHQSYWHRKLDGAGDSTYLHTDFKRPLVKTYKGSTITSFVSADVENLLQMVTQNFNVSLFVVLVATLKLLLFKYTYEKDITLGTSVAGRDHPDLENQVGFYVNTLALRTQFFEDDSFADLLRAVDQTVMEGLQFQAYPFDLLVEELASKRDLNEFPFFQIKVVLQSTADITGLKNFSGDDDLQGISIHDCKFDTHVSLNDLSLRFAVSDKRLSVDISYNTDLFTAERINQFYRHWEQIVRQAGGNPYGELISYSYTTEEENAQLLKKYSNF